METTNHRVREAWMEAESAFCAALKAASKVGAALQAKLDDPYTRAAEAEMDSRSYQEDEDDDQV